MFSSPGLGAHGEHSYGGQIPTKLVNDIVQLKYSSEGTPGEAARAFKYLADPAPTGAHAFVRFPATASYSPVLYPAVAVGIRIGRWLHLSTLATLWLARIAGLCLYVAIAARAIYHLQARGWLMATVAVSPLCVLQAATISADGVTNALVLLAIALAFQLISTKTEPPSRGMVVEAIAIAVALGLAKPPYVLLLLLFIPVAVSRDAARRLGIAVIGSGFAASLAWNLYAQGLYSPGGVTPQVNTRRQLKFVAGHPLKFLSAIVSTLRHSGGRIAHEVLIPTPAWNPPFVFLLGTTGLVIVGLVLSTGRLANVFAACRRPFVLTTMVIGGLIAGAVFLLAYVGWNPVGASQIAEFQGRYLFPCLALIVIALGRGAIRPYVRGAVPLYLMSAATTVGVVGLSIHFY